MSSTSNQTSQIILMFISLFKNVSTAASWVHMQNLIITGAFCLCPTHQIFQIPPKFCYLTLKTLPNYGLIPEGVAES